MYTSNHERKLINEICLEIEKYNNFILTTHQLPDGDGLSCELAFFDILINLGQNVVIVNELPARPIFNFLPYFSKIVNPEIYRRLRFKPDVAIVFDCSSKERVGRPFEDISDARVIINIDHHEGNTLFGDINLVSCDRSSVGEICFLIAKKLGCLNEKVAECLYVAILTDTGSFRHHFDVGTFNVSEKLLQTGIDPEIIAYNIYHNNSVPCLRLVGYALSNLQYDDKIRTAWTVLTGDIYRRTRALEQDTEIVVDMLRTIKDADIIFIVKEKKREIKFSLRSRKGINVRRIAERFGGGGHNNAAGFSFQGISIEQAVLRFLRYLRSRQQEDKDLDD